MGHAFLQDDATSDSGEAKTSSTFTASRRAQPWTTRSTRLVDENRAQLERARLHADRNGGSHQPDPRPIVHRTAHVQPEHSSSQGIHTPPDLFTLRHVIQQYTLDKQKAPQALEDLIAAHYLKFIPKDPITGRNDTWQVEQEDSIMSPDQTQPGIIDVTAALI